MTGSPRTTWQKWLLPSLPDIVFILIFLKIITFTDMNSCDLGWHLKLGKHMIDTGSLLHTDMFTHTVTGETWLNHSWLSDVMFSGIWKVLGLWGVVLLEAIVISLTFYLLFKFLLAQKSDLVVAIILVILAAAASALHWHPRPHIFSMLLMLIWYWILDDYQLKGKNRLYILPPLMILWVNLHGGFLGGLVLLGIYFLGNLLSYVTSSEVSEKINYRRALSSLGFTLAACLVASLINPYVYKVLPFAIGPTSPNHFINHVQEWASPNFHESLIFEYIVLLLIVTLGLTAPRLSFIEIGLLVFWLYLSLYAVRFIPVFVLISAPIMGRHLTIFLKESLNNEQVAQGIENILKKILSFSERNTLLNSNHDKHLALVLVVLFFSGICLNHGYVGNERIIEYRFDKEKFPVKAVQFIKENDISGNMFNYYGWGGYLIYSLYPEYRVFMDGRGDIGRCGLFKSYQDVVALKPDWKTLLETYKINWVIYRADSALATFLSDSKDWKLIYSDQVAKIFVRDIRKNQSVIGKYAQVSQHL